MIEKNLWLHQENHVKQKVTSCWAAQDSWSWSKPQGNNNRSACVCGQGQTPSSAPVLEQLHSQNWKKPSGARGKFTFPIQNFFSVSPSPQLFTSGNSLCLNLPFSESFSALIMSIREFSSECMSKVLVRSCKETQTEPGLNTWNAKTPIFFYITTAELSKNNIPKDKGILKISSDRGNIKNYNIIKYESDL